MESYLPARLPFVPDSLLVGVLGGVGFMCFALVLLLVSACLINYKRNQRHISRENGKGKERGEKEKRKAHLFLWRLLQDTHFDELHHEYHHLFHKILMPLLIHYKNHILMAWILPFAHVWPLYSVVKIIDAIYITY